ncbi:hypothetical protein DL95DRAFT_470637 [Leptodontidium sp. 2 PMI_412]|nr:hypothetical protein DL95DRAFT_470637 [Leptodontidium sp. 2 PMI_412]
MSNRATKEVRQTKASPATQMLRLPPASTSSTSGRQKKDVESSDDDLVQRLMDEIARLKYASSQLKSTNTYLKSKNTQLKQINKQWERFDQSGALGRIFTCFMKLPKELRLVIWREALNIEEVIVIAPSPKANIHEFMSWFDINFEAQNTTYKSNIRFVCHEAKEEANKALVDFARGVSYNPDTDVFWIPNFENAMGALQEANEQYFGYSTLWLYKITTHLAISLAYWARSQRRAGADYAFYEFGEKKLQKLVIVVRCDRWQKGHPVKFVEPRYPPSYYPQLNIYADPDDATSPTWDMVGERATGQMAKWKADRDAAYRAAEEADDGSAEMMNDDPETACIEHFTVPKITFREAVIAY